MFSIILFLAWDRVEISVRWEGDSVNDFITGVVEDENTTSIMVEGEKHYDDFIITGVVEDENTTSIMVEGEKHYDDISTTGVVEVEDIAALTEVLGSAIIIFPVRVMILVWGKSYVDFSITWVVQDEVIAGLTDKLGSIIIFPVRVRISVWGKSYIDFSTTYITNPVPFPILPNAQTESYAMYGSVSEQCDLGVTDDNAFTVEHIPMKEVVDYNILVNGMSAIKLLLWVGSEGCV
jgi:hypothetical protein